MFAGSSSFRFWDTLASDMKPLEVLNRGFGGSEFSDLDQYADRIVVAYRPRAVVVYEGDNDLAKGSPKTPEMVAADFRKFVQIVHGALPETWIYIVAIKPLQLRWNEMAARMKAANKLMQDYAATQGACNTSTSPHPCSMPTEICRATSSSPTVCTPTAAELYAMWTAITSNQSCSNALAHQKPRFFSGFLRALCVLGVKCLFFPRLKLDTRFAQQLGASKYAFLLLE